MPKKNYNQILRESKGQYADHEFYMRSQMLNADIANIMM